MAKGVKGSSPSEENKPVKTSFAIDPIIMQKLRYIKVMTNQEITDMVKDSLQAIIDKYEKKNGPIPIK